VLLSSFIISSPQRTTFASLLQFIPHCRFRSSCRKVFPFRHFLASHHRSARTNSEVFHLEANVAAITEKYGLSQTAQSNSNSLVIPRRRYHIDRQNPSSREPNIHEAYCVKKRQNAQNGPCKQRHGHTTSHLKGVADLEFRDGAFLATSIPASKRSSTPRLRPGRGAVPPRRAVCVLIWLWVQIGPVCPPCRLGT